ncbi:MAG: hypothetical protein RDU59_12300 [Thermodesulfobacteriota bacterium]|nr:hypothetical protein [Thermodesulfobacteriota bacterium]
MKKIMLPRNADESKATGGRATLYLGSPLSYRNHLILSEKSVLTKGSTLERAFVGDKTCWISANILLFTKGKALVRIEVNPHNLGKNYTLKIAESIVKKL